MSLIAPPLPRGRGWNFATHRKHGYAGGDDFEVPTGTVITSIADGVATRVGTVIIIRRPNGTQVILRHVDAEFTGAKSVNVGTPIATSGADGGKWPHWEAWTVSGVRESVYDLLAAEAAASSANSAKNYVRRIASYLNARNPGWHTNAAANGIRGPIYWRLIQRTGKRDGLYGAGYIVNGIPGPRTRQLEQHYATLAK